MANEPTVARRPSVLCVILAFAVASGCTTLRPVVPTATGGYSSIQPGDHLRIVTRDGRELRLVAVAVTSDSLVGNPPDAGAPPVTVPLSEIVTIDEVQYSPAMGIPVAAGCVGVIVTTVALVIFYAIWAIGRSSQDRGPDRHVADPAAP